jgi:hypothetical protein
MPKPGSATPALSITALTETVDLLGVVVAQMAERLKLQEQALAGVQKVTLESREAAQAAKQQTDPARYARHIEQEFDKTIGRVLDRLDVQHSNFEADRRDTRFLLDDLIRQEENVLQRLRDDLADARRWKKHTPFIALFGLVLAFGVAIALPRFMANYSITCEVLGGSWVLAKAEEAGCVFFMGQ